MNGFTLSFGDNDIYLSARNWGGALGSGPDYQVRSAGNITALSVIAEVFENTGGNLWVNGILGPLGSDQILTRPFQANSPGGFALGERYNAAGSLTGERPNMTVCEVLYYDRALTAGDRQLIEGYLAWKWSTVDALSSAHPYKEGSPKVFVPGVLGAITGTVKIDGVAAQRQLIGISYAPQEFEGEETPRRIVVGETTSAEDGTYTLETQGFIDEVIVLALDNYGEIWRPNRAYEVGDRIRPTRGNETGYGYDITIAGTSGATEPDWWVPAGGSDTGSIGTATAQAKPLWWSVAHAPILPTEIDPEDSEP